MHLLFFVQFRFVERFRYSTVIARSKATWRSAPQKAKAFQGKADCHASVSAGSQ